MELKKKCRTFLTKLSLMLLFSLSCVSHIYTMVIMMLAAVEVGWCDSGGGMMVVVVAIELGHGGSSMVMDDQLLNCVNYYLILI